jgi:hypothetical protein
MIKLNHLLAPKQISQRTYDDFSVSPMIVSGGFFAGPIVSFPLCTNVYDQLDRGISEFCCINI